ncbi:MAG: hypothetical protein HZA51_07270 [Planctomycetes bacterium]|nr:hypothetical protein [Planctomycetota bacterium]
MNSRLSRLPGGKIAAMVCALIALTGCDPTAGGNGVSQSNDFEQKLAEANRIRAAQSDQLAEQARVIQQLRGMDASKRLEQLVHVDRIEIERLSGGYDDDKDGRDDGVIVYLRLLDAEGDVIKATGSASVKLFDLSKGDGGQPVAQGRWTAEQMRTLWFGKMMTDHYSLRVPLPSGISITPGAPLTATVEFTDLMTGRTFQAQKPCEVAGLASANP